MYADLWVEHFFSGAALYANQEICASWSPGGLTFKPPETEVSTLLSSGKASLLKCSEKGHHKEGDTMFENPEASEESRWKNCFLNAIRQAS